MCLAGTYSSGLGDCVLFGGQEGYQPGQRDRDLHQYAESDLQTSLILGAGSPSSSVCSQCIAGTYSTASGATNLIDAAL